MEMKDGTKKKPKRAPNILLRRIQALETKVDSELHQRAEEGGGQPRRKRLSKKYMVLAVYLATAGLWDVGQWASSGDLFHQSGVSVCDDDDDGDLLRDVSPSTVHPPPATGQVAQVWANTRVWFVLTKLETFVTRMYKTAARTFEQEGSLHHSLEESESWRLLNELWDMLTGAELNSPEDEEPKVVDLYSKYCVKMVPKGDTFSVNTDDGGGCFFREAESGRTFRVWVPWELRRSHCFKKSGIPCVEVGTSPEEDQLIYDGLFQSSLSTIIKRTHEDFAKSSHHAIDAVTH